MRGDVDIRQIQAFLAVAEELHFGRAAERLHIAQPPLSQTIRSLERELGVELFARTTRSVRLTAAGSALMAPARIIETQLKVCRTVTRAAALPFVTKSGPLIHKAWGYKGDYNYGVNTYQRTAIALRTLEAYVGEETMRKILQTYFERWKFRHPTSQDFFDTASEVAGEDLSWMSDRQLVQFIVTAVEVQLARSRP